MAIFIDFQCWESNSAACGIMICVGLRIPVLRKSIHEPETLLLRVRPDLNINRGFPFSPTDVIFIPKADQSLQVYLSWDSLWILISEVIFICISYLTLVTFGCKVTHQLRGWIPSNIILTNINIFLVEETTALCPHDTGCLCECRFMFPPDHTHLLFSPLAENWEKKPLLSISFELMTSGPKVGMLSWPSY